MEKKKVEIRRKTRQQQVHHLRARIRENLVDSITKHQKAAQDNQSVLQCIRQGNISALFDLALDSEWSNLRELPQQSARECFYVLSLNMHDHKAAIILQRIVKLHWDRIFQGRSSCSQVFEQFLESISRRIDELVSQMKRGVLDENGAASMGLNAYLAIFKQFCQRLTSTIYPACIAWTIGKVQYTQEQLHNWLPCLLGNKLVLVCLARVIGIETPFQSQLLALFQKQLSFTANLASLILNKNEQTRIPALNILTIVVIEQALSERFVCATTESYLDIMESFYYEYKQKTSREYHQLLFRTFEGLEKLLSSAAVADYCLTGYYRLDINFFRLLFNFLGAEHLANRLTLHKVMIASIQILRNQGISMAQRLDRAHYSFLAKEVRQETSAQILSAAIRLLLTLLRSLKSSGYPHYLDILNLLEAEEVPLALEVLQFHSNRQVTLFAGQLLTNEFQQQEYPEDIHWSENRPVI